jgi:tellurite methyltransferase
MSLQAQFGNIDIYLFDQILRGRITPGMRVFDAGCGGGRNLVYFLRQGYDVCGVDANPAAVAQVRTLAAELASESQDHFDTIAPRPTSDFRVEAIEASSFPDAHADVVIANAVLHFARDHGHFEAMLRGMWRVLRPGGILLARLASTIGMAEQMTPIGEGRYRLPSASAAKGGYGETSPKLAGGHHASEGGDGVEWFLVDAPALLDWTRRLGGELIDPLKTTVVHEQRAMTTWVVRRAPR